ncbi:hypothetical protein GLE_5071 [Lysobacter enzymogenes]|uniref:Fibronectin type-III domain-containing protein n=1 Tax=Lysobacter enzymogenes TaxID=69 RepID=A0A0S2DPE0_LYSEN|nr:hypothetical protein GLE_5071 [Lysobacter enzymogenes]
MRHPSFSPAKLACNQDARGASPARDVPMKLLRFRALALSLLAATALVACGGGGGGKDAPNTGPNPATPGTPGTPGPTAPSAPTRLIASAGVGRVELSWNAAPGATSYEIYQGLAPGAQGAAPVVRNVAGTAATVAGLAPGSTYYFMVRAVNAGGSSAPSNEASATPLAQAPTAALDIAALELAQTHVLPAQGLGWTLSAASESYHAIGGRPALALLRLSAADARNVRLEGWADGTLLGAVEVAPPAALPPTEGAGPAYATDRYSADIPAAWMTPALQLRLRADNYLPGAAQSPLIGADSSAVLRVLPFYLFGATPDNSVPLSVSGLPDAATVDEIYAKWPVARLIAQNHPAQATVWPTLVVPPKGGKPAYLAHNADAVSDKFHLMSSVLAVLGGLIDANGERPAPVQFYAPLILFDAAGRVVSPGGGLGGGEVGTGDHAYRGIFIHEQGHAMGLPHQGEAYRAGRYPYAGGSLAGSAWGYDAVGKRFQPPFMPTTSARYARCRGDTFDGAPRQIDAEGRCVKQDPMQSGAGDQAPEYRFSTFSDYSTGMYQRYFEGTTQRSADGRRSYSGGSVIQDAAFASGYRRWDTIDRRWVEAATATTSGGLFGLDQNLPQRRDVPLYAIAMTLSNAGTPEVSQIYPPLSYTGNLLRYIDPTDAAQRASIVPDTSVNFWYCRNGGCDYTLRATYADGSVRHVLIQDGFRPFNQARGTPPASASDPLDGDSFRTWVVHVPADKALRRIELLHTPMVWEGFPASPAVLAARDVAAPLAPLGFGADAASCTELPTIAVPASALPPPRCADPAAAAAAAVSQAQSRLRGLLRDALRR